MSGGPEVAFDQLLALMNRSWGIAGGAIDIQKVNIADAMTGRRFDQRH